MLEHHAPIAQPVQRDSVTPILTVVFDVPVPDVYEPTLVAARAWYRDQADALVRALEAHCPGGFMDALLGSLLTRKASVFVVPDVILGGGA